MPSTSSSSSSSAISPGGSAVAVPSGSTRRRLPSFRSKGAARPSPSVGGRYSGRAAPRSLHFANSSLGRWRPPGARHPPRRGSPRGRSGERTAAAAGARRSRSPRRPWPPAERATPPPRSRTAPSGGSPCCDARQRRYRSGSSAAVAITRSRGRSLSSTSTGTWFAWSSTPAPHSNSSTAAGHGGVREVERVEAGRVAEQLEVARTSATPGSFIRAQITSGGADRLAEARARRRSCRTRGAAAAAFSAAAGWRRVDRRARARWAAAARGRPGPPRCRH